MNAEIVQIEALAKETLRRCLADEEPADILDWLKNTIVRLGGGDESAVMTWPESFDFTDRMLEQFKATAQIPEKDRKILSWPWASWNKIIGPMKPGMLGVVTAPDGQGKTIYAECIAENWASKRNRVVFLHYELNRQLMMERRLARYTGIDTDTFEAGKYTPAQEAAIATVRPFLSAWEGLITYLHTPGWTMERTIAELDKLHAQGDCDAVVLDYLEKVAASPRQLKMFGSALFQREADNVEQLKNFAERTGVPVLEIAQMSKEGKQKGADVMDRTAMRGAGEKSEKANLVILLKRERVQDGYSKEVEVLVDKNTMGKTGAFRQMMQPEFFRVGDIVQERKP